MPEYIERDSVLNIVKGNWLFMNSADDAIQTSIEMTRRLPAADVRPVVHGKWERKRDKCGSFVSCSVCHTSGWYQFAFCPYCGADMRKEGGEKDV